MKPASLLDAFVLIELFAVIAMIALLVAIRLRARANGRC